MPLLSISLFSVSLWHNAIKITSFYYDRVSEGKKWMCVQFAIFIQLLLLKIKTLYLILSSVVRTHKFEVIREGSSHMKFSFILNLSLLLIVIELEMFLS